VSFYNELGVRRVTNAATTLTVVGGSLMPDEVLDAMRSAAGSYVDMHELTTAAGKRLAELTHNEAAYVTCGCAAALTLGTLGAITGGDPGAISRLPAAADMATDVIIHAAHRIPYDRAIELAAGRLVQIGNVQQTFEWELEAAITERTALVVWVAGSHLPAGALDLPTTVRIARQHGVPVLVDAAAQLPPSSNLWHYTRDGGADAAVFSGGKALRGPQSSGLMVGTDSFVAAARANGPPHQRLARALKVGKEEIAGLVRAVELYLQQDHDAIFAEWESIVSSWLDALRSTSGVTATRAYPNEAGQPVPRVRIAIDRTTVGANADEIRTKLWEQDPRVLVLRGDADTFFITPDTLAQGEAESLVGQILKVIEDTRQSAFGSSPPRNG
jgi:L-seryl-tRNA(Ser) seleniumtransferase